MFFLGFNRYKVLKQFFDFPNSVFHLRQISRDTGISFPSVRNHVKALLESGFIERVETGLYPGFKFSNADRARLYKRNDLILRLFESGLIDVIEEKSRPNCIVLYGSSVEGLDDDRGDIDLFIQSPEISLSLSGFEKSLNRSVSLVFEQDIKKLSGEFLNNLANGIVLKGFLKLK